MVRLGFAAREPHPQQPMVKCYFAFTNLNKDNPEIGGNDKGVKNTSFFSLHSRITFTTLLRKSSLVEDT
jgi:hypothetical protein